MTDLARLTEAAAFAARLHTGQTRKGAGAEPYINHVLDVAHRLATARPDDALLVLGGLLHDTVEDSETSLAEIEARFGPDVAALVGEVTDDKSLPKPERKRLQVEHAPETSPRARMLKLADKAANLTDIATSPPMDWPLARRRDYLDWARAVAAGCRGVDARLEAEFDAAAERLEQQFAAEAAT